MRYLEAADVRLTTNDIKMCCRLECFFIVFSVFANDTWPVQNTAPPVCRGLLEITGRPPADVYPFNGQKCQLVTLAKIAIQI